MRFGLSILLLSCVAAPWAAQAQETFPYKAYVSADDVYVRSGPGKNYYPTEKLLRGAEVEVYRHDPGGWYAIRPPQGSFSWIAGRSIRPLTEKESVAEVTGPRVAAFVGSRFSDIREVSQVHLDRGEQVEVFGDKRFVSEGQVTAETWCRIAPPAGEFRWVNGRFVTRQGGALPPPGNTAADDDANNNNAALAASQKKPGSTDGVAAAAYNAPISGPPQTSAARSAEEPRGEAVAIPAPGVRSPTAPVDPIETELNDINLQLSLMIAEDPKTWQFDALKARVDAALSGARTALLRGRAHEAAREIQRYEGIRRRTLEMVAMRAQTDQQNLALKQAADTAKASVTDPAGDLSKFDGVGRLTPVVSRREGAPRFALTDAGGGVITFVTPDAQLALEPYVGRVVGLSGVRQYYTQLKKPNLVARQLTELSPTALR